jgi:tRNA A-37 threonylcarbamoyl transferase component Bud32
MDGREGDLTGRVVAGQFRVERKLGQGGMGAVYLADQFEMGRKVVLKVMHPSLLGSAAGPAIEERFKREARMVAQLNHPNVVQVHLFGRTDDQQLFLAMEYVEGRTLRDLLTETGVLPEARALRILDQICGALIDAHGLGLVHRDLKPDNVMLSARHGNVDYVKVLDFGIAKLRAAPDVKLTQTGAILGTPQYMAPEQALSKPVDQRTDLYALGIMLYEMLTGCLPFSGDSLFEILQKQVSVPIERPGARYPMLAISPDADAIVARAADKTPENRFQSAAELQRELRRVLDQRPAPKAVEDLPAGGAAPIGRTAILAGPAEELAIAAGGAGGTALLPPPVTTDARLEGLDSRQTPPPRSGTPAPREPRRRTGLLVAVIGLAVAVIAAGVIAARGRDDRAGDLPASLADLMGVSLAPISGGFRVCSQRPLHRCRARAVTHLVTRNFPPVDIAPSASCETQEQVAAEHCAGVGKPHDVANVRCLASQGILSNLLPDDPTAAKNGDGDETHRLTLMCAEGTAFMHIYEQP